jgi:hypothetical protein
MTVCTKLSYSISSSIIITTVSYFFYGLGGEIILVPGMLLEGWLNIILILITDDNYIWIGPTWVLFNVGVYAAIIYIGLWISDKVIQPAYEVEHK